MDEMTFEAMLSNQFNEMRLENHALKKERDRWLDLYSKRNSEYNDIVNSDLKTRIKRVFNPYFKTRKFDLE